MIALASGSVSFSTATASGVFAGVALVALATSLAVASLSRFLARRTEAVDRADPTHGPTRTKPTRAD